MLDEGAPNGNGLLVNTQERPPFKVPGRAPQPRPMKGIFVAITVMNRTLASSGRLAM